MASYPGTLPQDATIAGYSEPFGANIIRSQMETGAAKMRRRFTTPIYTFDLKQILTSAQVDTLLAFFDTTLAGGVDAFTWKHPRTGDAASMRFTSPPVVVSAGANFSVTLPLEVIP